MSKGLPRQSCGYDTVGRTGSNLPDSVDLRSLGRARGRLRHAHSQPPRRGRFGLGASLVNRLLEQRVALINLVKILSRCPVA
jgi:hypothetical protein